MEWTHAICDKCWEKREPGRAPLRLKGPFKEPDICCFCGADTDGIYVRHDPRELTCSHEEE